MICKACREQQHSTLVCPGLAYDKTWCDCQHDTSGTALNPAFVTTSNEAK